MLGDSHPFYMMRNHLIQSFNKANSEAALNIKTGHSRKRTATDSTLSTIHSEPKIPKFERKQTERREDIPTSSPQESKNKVIYRYVIYHDIIMTS